MIKADLFQNHAHAKWFHTLLTISCMTSLAIGAATAATATDAANEQSAVTDQLRILEISRQQADALPKNVADPHIDRDSARMLADTAAAKHWTVIRDTSDICLVSVLSSSKTMGMTCAPGEVFQQRGLSQSLSHHNGERVEAYLVPDGKIQSIAEKTGWTALSPNLLVGDPSAEPVGKVSTEDGSFTLDDLGPTPDSFHQQAPAPVEVKDSAAGAVVKYADNRPARRLVKLASHTARHGAVMTGAHAEIVDYPYATMHSELVGIEPPHHVISQNKGKGFVRVTTTDPVIAISRCWWSVPEPFDIEPGLHCWYST